MGIFKNDNEFGYVGHRKHWTDVIKNSGDGSFLIWRQPEEDFNTNSTLIVMPGEQAIFVKGGNIEQVFDSGTYKLTTENYPVVSRLRNAFSGGVSTFNCVVYFVRTAHSAEIEWGTMTPIQYWDDTYGNLTIKSFGAYKISISNASLFLTKLIGNNTKFESQSSATHTSVDESKKEIRTSVESREGLDQYFRNEFQMHIVETFAGAIDSIKKSTGKEVFALANNLTLLANAVSPKIATVLDGYGIKLEIFSVASCKIAAVDPEVNKMIMDRKRMEYLGQVNNIGTGWHAQQQMDILRNISENPNAGGLASVGAGLGLAANAMGQISNMTMQQMTPNEKSPMQKLKDLKELLDMGLISQSDFDTKKSEILSNM